MYNSDRDNFYDDNYVGDREEYSDARRNEEPVKYQSRYRDDFHDRRSQDVNEKRRPKRKKHVFRNIILKLLLFVFLLAVAVLIIGWVLSLTLPVKTNVLIMATDEGGTRTDTIMVGTFDKIKKSISIISVPRDSYVTVSDDAYAKMNEEYPEPGSKSMKINAIYHFAGKKYGKELLIDEVESLLGMEIKYYAKIDFKAFKYIVDSVGGIDFDVPQDMKYSDPTQDLYIDLKEGKQHLNGDQAEQVVRYRSGYSNADIGRISVQQNFMKAFIGQTLSKGTILSHPSVYLNTMFKYKYLETNASFMDILPYVMVIGGVDTKNVKTYTLPGRPTMKGGQSVYLVNDEEKEKTVNEIMN